MAEGIAVLMLVPGVEGSATLKGSDPGEDGSHEGWIPIESCSFSLTRETTAVDPKEESEAPALPATEVAPLTIARVADRSTAQLLMWLANAKKEQTKKDKVLIDYCAPSGRYYLRYELAGAELVSSSIQFEHPDDLSETLTLTYDHLKIFQRKFNIKGEVDPSPPSMAEYEVPHPEGSSSPVG